MAGLVHHARAKPFTLPRRMTSAEYWELPQDAPRLELIHGKTHMVPAPDEWHQDIVTELVVILHGHLHRSGGGRVFPSPIGLTLPDNTELQPDVVVLQSGHPELGTRFRSVTHPPLLVIEILSPSNRKHDRKTKFGLYQDFGVPNYWIADPDARSIEAWTLVAGAYQPSGQATAPARVALAPFPDLLLDLGTVFPKVP